MSHYVPLLAHLLAVGCYGQNCLIIARRKAPADLWRELMILLSYCLLCAHGVVDVMSAGVS